MRMMTIPITLLGLSALWVIWGVEPRAQQTTTLIAGIWALNEDLSDELPRSLGNRPDNPRERDGVGGRGGVAGSVAALAGVVVVVAVAVGAGPVVAGEAVTGLTPKRWRPCEKRCSLR